jgi:hypothetical protein
MGKDGKGWERMGKDGKGWGKVEKNFFGLKVDEPGRCLINQN